MKFLNLIKTFEFTGCSKDHLRQGVRAQEWAELYQTRAQDCMLASDEV